MPCWDRDSILSGLPLVLVSRRRPENAALQAVGLFDRASTPSKMSSGRVPNPDYLPER